MAKSVTSVTVVTRKAPLMSTTQTSPLDMWLTSYKASATQRRAARHLAAQRPRATRPAGGDIGFRYPLTVQPSSDPARPARPKPKPIRSHFAKIRAAGVRLASELGDPPPPLAWVLSDRRSRRLPPP